MITSVDESVSFEEILSRLAPDDPFACRIISLYNSYKPSLVFVDYWLITADNGEYTGAIARNGTNFILLLTPDSDLEEVSSFMRVAGASAIICDGAYELTLSGGRTLSGVVLKRSLPYEDCDPQLNVEQPDIRSAYELINKCADDNFTPPAFEDFYVDVNHKLRHRSMSLCAIMEEGRAVSLAMTVAESKTGAVLGAVSCDPDFRRRGFGTAIVKHLTNLMTRQGKTVFLHRAENANAAFYSELGFEPAGTWREYYL